VTKSSLIVLLLILLGLEYIYLYRPFEPFAFANILSNGANKINLNYSQKMPILLIILAISEYYPDIAANDNTNIFKTVSLYFRRHFLPIRRADLNASASLQGICGG
jgi:hypothetical protein